MLSPLKSKYMLKMFLIDEIDIFYGEFVAIKIMEILY